MPQKYPPARIAVSVFAIREISLRCRDGSWWTLLGRTVRDAPPVESTGMQSLLASRSSRGGRRARVSRRLPDHALPQRLERRAQLRREECRLFPCREVSAAVDLVEVGEAGVDRLDPAARGSPELAGERRESDRNPDRRRSLAGRT